MRYSNLTPNIKNLKEQKKGMFLSNIHTYMTEIWAGNWCTPFRYVDATTNKYLHRWHCQTKKAKLSPSLSAWGEKVLRIF
jgi:hypothetical protein